MNPITEGDTECYSPASSVAAVSSPSGSSSPKPSTTSAGGERASHADLLRGIADLLDQHPDLPLPEVTRERKIEWFTAHSAEDVALILRAVRGPWAKNDPNASDYDAETATFTATFMGCEAKIFTSRESVCTRKVVGTREVTKVVPVTTEEVTVTEEIFEWECKSVLAPITGGQFR